MALQLRYSKEQVGAKLTVVKDGAQAFSSISDHGTAYNLKKGQFVILTGYRWYDGRYFNYLQTTTGLYIPIDTLNGTENDWVIDEGYDRITLYSQSQAQVLVDKIIKNNAKIVCNNLLCARYASKLTADERSQVRTLQKRLQARNEALQSEGLCTDIQTSRPTGYSELESYLDKLMSGEGVGIAAWAVVVIAAVVITGTATAAYYTYKSLADQSESDVKFSQQLTRTLTAKLTPEEYAQLQAETKGIVTKARIKQLLSNYGGMLKYAAFAVAGYTIYKLIKDKI